MHKLHIFSAVPFPPRSKLAMKDVFDDDGKPRIDVLKTHFTQEGRLEDDVKICFYFAVLQFQTSKYNKYGTKIA